ncbi:MULTISPECIES: hypothetical protein [Pseudonocardia]|uniref:Uncharacterized protein n=1 Tax=Pseudonocardia alni TaxID=33907 RepID=A0A852W8H3_PSEA5|nr:MULTISPECIES: hypothetical protein [Pseudonocardia]NYG05378.1 hypothetical protein [Pseudonocardia antarctica]
MSNACPDGHRMVRLARFNGLAQCGQVSHFATASSARLASPEE